MQHVDYCLNIIGNRQDIELIDKKLGGIASCKNLRALTGAKKGYSWFFNVAEENDKVEYSVSHLTSGKSEITIWIESFQDASYYDDLLKLTKKFPSLTIYCSHHECEVDGEFHTAVFENGLVKSEDSFDWHWHRIIPNLIVMQGNDSACANEIAMREFGEWTNLVGTSDIDDEHMLGLVTCTDLNNERGEIRDLLSWARILSAFPEREWQEVLTVHPDELRAMSKNIKAVLKFTKNLDDLVETLEEEELDEFDDIGWELADETVSFCKNFLKRLKSKQLSVSLTC